MTVDVRYVFFVSSTFEDLREERQQVVQAILEHGHIPVGMEVFPSSDDEPWQVVADTIRESDYYIVLSAGRYGHCFPDGKSFTEKEFDLAEQMGIPVVGFIHKAPLDRPAALREDDAEKRARLAAFHEKIRQRYVRTWATVEELGLQASKAVTNAIRMQPRIGWVRADKARSGADLEKIDDLRDQIEELDKENLKLTDDVSRLSDFLRKSVIAEADLEPALLAQGDDEFEFIVRYKKDDGHFEGPISLSWDECFAAIAPDLYQVVQQKTYNGQYNFESGLKTLLRKKAGLSGPRTVSYDKIQFDKVIFQFKQLGYLRLAESKSGYTGWTLTQLGEAYATRLLTQPKS